MEAQRFRHRRKAQFDKWRFFIGVLTDDNVLFRENGLGRTAGLNRQAKSSTCSLVKP